VETEEGMEKGKGKEQLGAGGEGVKKGKGEGRRSEGRGEEVMERENVQEQTWRKANMPQRSPLPGQHK